MYITEKEVKKWSWLFKAFSHPERLKIALLLYVRGKMRQTDIQEKIKHASWHTSELRKAGVIKGKRDGVNVWYSLVPEAEELLNLIVGGESEVHSET